MSTAPSQVTLPAPALHHTETEGAVHFILKASRPGFWSTTWWFYLLPFAGQNVFHDWRFWVGALYFGFPFGMLLYGWNDLVDRETDRRNPRKGNLLFGARGTDAQLRRLPVAIAVSQAPFLAGFWFLLGWKVAWWYVLLLLANFTYNAPQLNFKGRPPLDLLNQVGYLLVFPLASWLLDVPPLPWQTWVFSGLFAMLCHLFGQILDLDADAHAGRRTTATVLGMVGAKYGLAALSATIAAFTAVYFRNLYVTGAFVCAAAGFLLDARFLFRAHLYPPQLVRLSAYGLNAMAFATMYPVWASGCLLPAW